MTVAAISHRKQVKFDDKSNKKHSIDNSGKCLVIQAQEPGLYFFGKRMALKRKLFTKKVFLQTHLTMLVKTIKVIKTHLLS